MLDSKQICLFCCIVGYEEAFSLRIFDYFVGEQGVVAILIKSLLKHFKKGVPFQNRYFEKQLSEIYKGTAVITFHHKYDANRFASKYSISRIK